MKQSFGLAILLSLFLFSCKKDPVETVYYPTVKTIIQNHCLSCHAPGGQGMPVFLVTDEDITSRAASIKSATIDPVSPQNKRMPLDGELQPADKDAIQKWFDKGGRITD